MSTSPLRWLYFNWGFLGHTRHLRGTSETILVELVVIFSRFATGYHPLYIYQVNNEADNW
jgi:hypothetical protein